MWGAGVLGVWPVEAEKLKVRFGHQEVVLRMGDATAGGYGQVRLMRRSGYTGQ